MFLNKNKLAQANGLLPKITRVICRNVLGLYQQHAHKMLTKITEHADIVTINKNRKALIY